MSYTELYKISKIGNVSLHDEFKNASRGALLVWNELDRKYLPPYIPSWFTPRKGWESVSRVMSGEEKHRKKVWDLWKDNRLTKAEKIVMCSTFDGVYVSKDNFSKIELAFLEFGDQFPHSSYHEQASAISRCAQSKRIYGVCWNQTSVNGDMYREQGVNGGEKIYNIHTVGLGRIHHWELFKGHPELL